MSTENPAWQRGSHGTDDASNSNMLAAIEAAVMARAGRREGNEFRFRCPDHRPDTHPSARWCPAKAVWCCDACDAGGGWTDLARKLGIPMEGGRGSASPGNASNLRTPYGIAEYAAEKRLPIDYLRKRGLTEIYYDGHPAVRIPFWDLAGNVVTAQYRWPGEKRFKSGAPTVLYGLDRLARYRQTSAMVVLCEGASDQQTMDYHGFAALGLPGASNWKDERDAGYFAGFGTIYVILEPDAGGEAVRKWLAKSKIRDRARLVKLDGFKDPSAMHVDSPDLFKERFQAALDAAVALGGERYSTGVQVRGGFGWTSAQEGREATSGEGLTLLDFRAYMPMHQYVYRPTRELWPASSVNARIDPVPTADGKGEPASTWLDRNQPVEQMTWSPGDPELLEGRLIDHGGWVEHPGTTAFNLYRPPTIVLGDASAAVPWLTHVAKIYPDDADHILDWLAHRVQRPQEKLNHALVLGGEQGIGKDTILEPIKHAVGPWNFREVAPTTLMERFNPFLKSVILRVSEARDLGDTDRYALFEHTKTLIAAPPDVLRIDEKNLREYSIPNVLGMVFTTNNKTTGLFIAPDDRRHFVAWSDCTKEGFDDNYWRELWQWYESGGYSHVAAFLAERDLSCFNPKAPPPKTQAWWEIVDANRAPENAEMATALEWLGNPNAVTVEQVATMAAKDDEAFAAWLRDRRNSRQIPHRFTEAGYTRVRNEGTKDGLWKVRGRWAAVYARNELSVRDRQAAARRLVEGSRGSKGGEGGDSASSSTDVFTPTSTDNQAGGRARAEQDRKSPPSPTSPPDGMSRAPGCDCRTTSGIATLCNTAGCTRPSVDGQPCFRHCAAEVAL